MANVSIFFSTLLKFILILAISSSSVIVNKQREIKPCSSTFNNILQINNENRPSNVIYKLTEQYKLVVNAKNKLINMQQKKLNQMETESNTLQQCKNNKEYSPQQIETKYAELQINLAQTEEKLKIAQNEIYQLLNDNYLAKNNINKLENEYELQKTVCIQTNDSSAKISQLNTEIVKLNSRYDNCQKNITNLSSQLTDNEQIVNSNYLTIQGLNSLLNTRIAEATINARETAQLKTELREKEKLLSDLQIDLNNKDLSFQIAHLNTNKSLELCQQQYKQIQSNQTACLTQLNLFEKLIDKLESNVTSQSNELQLCNYNITNLEESVKKQNATNSNQQSENINLQIKNSELNKKLLAISDQKESIIQEKDKYISQLTTQLANQTSKLTECNSAATNLQNSVKHLVEEQRNVIINDYQIKLTENLLNNTQLSTELTKTKSSLINCNYNVDLQKVKMENLTRQLTIFEHDSISDEQEKYKLETNLQNCENELNKKLQEDLTRKTPLICDEQENQNLESNLQKQLNNYKNLKSKFTDLKSLNLNLTCQLKMCKSQLDELDDKENKEPNDEYPPFKHYICNHSIPLQNGQEVITSCNTDYKNNQWYVIERRSDFVTSFNRSWMEYRIGFGNVQSEFFLGLENIYQITSMRRHLLYVRLTDGCDTVYARYDNFEIGNSDEGYAIKALGNYSGNAADGLRESLNMKFSTYDMDNDSNCAKNGNGGWWYTDCGKTNLHHKHFRRGYVMWNNVYNHYTSVEMMIRPVRIKDSSTDATE